MKTVVLLDNEIQKAYSNATLSEHIKVAENESYQIIHVISDLAEMTLNIDVEAQAKYEHWIINLSKNNVAYHLNLNLHGKGAETKLRGILIGNGKANLQHKVYVDHQADLSKADIRVHGIADEQSKVAFDGTIHVAKKVKGVDAKELLQNLLLSNQAEIDVKPILEIYSNDISCSHGASIGDLDEDALFYLESRGFNEHEAKEILLKAFATEFLAELENDALRVWIEQLILEKITK